MNSFYSNGDNFLVSDELIAKTSAEINATNINDGSQTYGDLQPGTLLHSAGYAVIKEKALDGSWVQL